MTGTPPRASAPPHTPAAITAGGPAAVAAWEDFLCGDGLAASTRNLYRLRAAHFLRWLTARGLDLTQATPALVASYLDGKTACPHSRMAYRTPLRRLLDCLAVRQVISHDVTRPGATTESKGRPARRRPAPASAPAAEDFPGGVSLDELKATVRAVDPALEEDPELFDAGVVLLASVALGTQYVTPISRFTGVSARRVAEFARRLRANGVWTADGRTAGSWADEEAGDVAFLIDVLTAAGLVERRGDDAAAGAVPGDQTARPPGE